MSSYPAENYYSKDHEWIRVEGDRGTVGVTDHAQHQLGDVVYVELPSVGASYDAGKVFGSVESVKAVSELYLPVGGEILEVNEALTETPELVNSDPHGAAWMVVIKIANPAELDSLMRAEAYEKFVKEEGGE